MSGPATGPPATGQPTGAPTGAPNGASPTGTPNGGSPTGPPAAGSPAPPFVLPDADRRPVALADLRGRAVVLVFYPFAFSRVCGGELAALRGAREEFQNETTQVLAVSVDSVHALHAWSELEGFGYPLLSDFWPHGAVARAYGVFDEQTGAARRATVIIDREGLVRWSVVNPVPQARELADYRAVLAGL